MTQSKSKYLQPQLEFLQVSSLTKEEEQEIYDICQNYEKQQCKQLKTKITGIEIPIGHSTLNSTRIEKEIKQDELLERLINPQNNNISEIINLSIFRDQENLSKVLNNNSQQKSQISIENNITEDLNLNTDYQPQVTNILKQSTTMVNNLKNQEIFQDSDDIEDQQSDKQQNQEEIQKNEEINTQQTQENVQKDEQKQEQEQQSETQQSQSQSQQIPKNIQNQFTTIHQNPSQCFPPQSQQTAQSIGQQIINDIFNKNNEESEESDIKLKKTEKISEDFKTFQEEKQSQSQQKSQQQLSQQEIPQNKTESTDKNQSQSQQNLTAQKSISLNTSQLQDLTSLQENLAYVQQMYANQENISDYADSLFQCKEKESEVDFFIVFSSNKEIALVQEDDPDTQYIFDKDNKFSLTVVSMGITPILNIQDAQRQFEIVFSSTEELEKFQQTYSLWKKQK